MLTTGRNAVFRMRTRNAMITLFNTIYYCVLLYFSYLCSEF
nr:MAG TPA: hypothetical protein [Caudoviricetes sp.]